ncbi:MAG: regulatory protein RecX [Microbacterium sp.]
MTDEERIAPVIPLFGGRAAEQREHGPGPMHPTRRMRAGAAAAWHTTWQDLDADAPAVAPAPTLRTQHRGGVRFVEIDEGEGARSAPDFAQAEARLLKALSVRSLSEREARERLRKDGVDFVAAEAIIGRLLRRGAIDDAALAEQLVYAGTSRRNQGRRAIAQVLAARGIAREVIDEALAELSDDDEERALEFARGRAPSLTRFDDDTALRRLVGQLTRRGYGGSLVMTVARRALQEARGAAT